MDTKAIEKFSIEAREQLLKDMEQQLYVYALDDAGRAEYAADADAIRGVVLSPAEHAQRTELYRRIEREGTLPFITTMAYTWFNRFAAIRYMELAGYLPSHVRMLTAADGSFNPECLRVATTLDLPGLDQVEVAQLIQTGDDEALYRAILIAQCNELAAFLPSVFGTVTSDALTLPQNLLNKTEFNVLYRLVTNIPEDAWVDVEILGWMYQFYNSAVKAEFFKSKRKAGAEDIAPATQLFTPDWIVRYMVDNSLGRLWMLNHPESTLREHAHAENPSDRLMEYYIEPDEEHEDFIRINSPEDITFCDPACGSGHILVYAFKMLMAIYQECGYREREISALILTKNLSGFEIDQRAAQIAQLALAMCARAYDRRFFTRNITANICVLNSIDVDMDELSLTSPLRNKEQLLQDLAHLSEIGSLMQPTPEDIAALEGDLVESNAGDLFSSNANEHVAQAIAACKALTRRFDVVVANPPYMGSSSFNPFMSKWVKKHYPDVKSDLFASFIVRIMDIAKDHGEVGIMCPFVWMFIGSYEKLRNKLIDEKTITSLIQLEYSGFAGATVPICTFTYHNSHIDGYKGGYVRLSDFVGAATQAPKALEAIQNPDCGWFYRADAGRFHDIPGSPIAYWAGSGLFHAFKMGLSMRDQFLAIVKGIFTGDNARFLRLWYEVSSKEIKRSSWALYTKGGAFRRWYGNIEHVVNWRNDAQDLRSFPGSGLGPSKYYGSYTFTWSKITSSISSFRFNDGSVYFDDASPALVIRTEDKPESRYYILGLLNSSVARHILSIIAPTLNCQVGDVSAIPVFYPEGALTSSTAQIVSSNIALSHVDWDSQETSWGFKRNPLV
ncbi:BREX-1 system adenine-specific DNA-methyltransferase PglX [Collinsella sp. An307]|uniref:BREX-1 system adenine-specific DNA-methyltransferase PglX n=1 Tax=Collinsella sp. An307 TaxID=1965630 RepID=UPI000B39F5A0|nr:BREX-1 system adenine-specific DNA-methyltransferase PglX [Collinsella sp. An307]OUO19304.1 hypothetical protein B5F89_08640 [Collinsella sp. An307]